MKKGSHFPYRYNAFLPLYPIGLLSEAQLVYLSLTAPLSTAAPLYNAYLFLGLLTYIPGIFCTFKYGL